MAKQNKNNALTLTKAAARKAHFANGGSTNLWCGKSNPHQDKKKAHNKRACRGKHYDT